GFKGTSSQDKLDFLSRMTASEILTKIPLLYGPPVIDGVFLPDYPYNLYKQGKYNKVDYLLGFNSHEGLLASHMIFNQIESTIHLNNVSAFRGLLRRIVGHNFRYNHDTITDAIMDEYTADHDITNVQRTEQLMCDIYGDMVIIAPTVELLTCTNLITGLVIPRHQNGQQQTIQMSLCLYLVSLTKLTSPTTSLKKRQR
ncbi:unnamed protein product, partial [Owenia fusiformis]